LFVPLVALTLAGLFETLMSHWTIAHPLSFTILVRVLVPFWGYLSLFTPKNNANLYKVPVRQHGYLLALNLIRLEVRGAFIPALRIDD
jgi:hypothetical protein